jgi:endonuclease YncB( thermonuclease family)
MAEQLPDVGRPKGSAWRHLQDQGIIWEGQILIAGDDADLAALLVVTSERLAFVRGGAVALEIDREWLYPNPVLRRNGTILLWVAAPGSQTSETLSLIVRDGRREAARLVSLLSPDEETWSTPAALPTYVPISQPQSPEIPMANHWDRGSDADQHPPVVETILPVFSTLDDDDFPPISNRSLVPSGWGWDTDFSGDLDGPIALAGSVRKPDSPLIPVPGLESRNERARRAWVIRLSGLVAAFALFAGFASGMLPGWGDIRDAINKDEPTVVTVAEVLAPTPQPTQAEEVAASTEVPTPSPTSTIENLPQTSDAQDPTVVPVETALVLGVGGSTEEEPSPTPEPTLQPTEPATATEAPILVPQSTETTVVEVAQASTEEPVDQTPIIPPPDATETTEPTVETATEVPTESVAVSASPENTESDTPAQGLVSDQSATLASDEIPADVFAVDGIRFSIDEAYRAESVPALTLGRSKTGEWIVLVITANNWSELTSTLNMADFRIASASDLATEYSLNATTGSVASYLGMNPVLKDGDSTDLDSGDEAELALVFEIPAGAGDVVLLAGGNQINLQTSIDRTVSGATGGGEGVAPELVAATVTDVIDGNTITVDADGQEFTVLYTGVAAPQADACYAAESTAANSDLVLGKTVLLERQRRSREETDVYLRDAWLVDENGNRTLVSAMLVDQGALTAVPKSPDTRFTGWLAGEQLAASSSGAGLWATCQVTSTESA